METRDLERPPPAHRPPVWAIFVPFLALGLAVYWACLQGAFVSDDHGYLTSNAWVQQPSWDHLLAILDPFGEPAAYLANWSPLHLLLHSLAWQAFGAAPLGHHVLNVVVHASASTLLVALLVRSGVALWPAIFGGAFFLLHPANVEAVAWISQLKSTAALALALGALLAQPRWPLASVALFLAALLVKPTAAFALPMLGGLLWTRRAPRRDWLWFGAWTLAAIAVLVPELESFRRGGEFLRPVAPDLALQLPYQAAIGMRYLVMAATSYGLSTFHEPSPVRSLLDPWWLSAIAAGAILAWRLLRMLRARDEEAAWWIAAAAGYAPVSQAFPFFYPMADRYLYFILPGLVGGALLAGGKATAALAPRFRAPLARIGPERLRFGLLVAACLPLALFGVRSALRADVFTSDVRMMLDSAHAYPGGVSANLMRVRRTARAGDRDGLLAAMSALRERGFVRFWVLNQDPSLAAFRTDPRYRELLGELASDWLVAAERLAAPTQSELHVMAMAYAARGERERALATLRRAEAAGGPRTQVIRTEIAAFERGQVLWGLPPVAESPASRAQAEP